MGFPVRPVAFVLSATNHGTLIVNKNDFCEIEKGKVFGVGQELLNRSCYAPEEVSLALAMLDFRRKYRGDGVVALDGGANIGIHSLEWARHMFGWGEVFSFEAQEAIFYALAGNLAMNNCFNAHARLTALGNKCGNMLIPVPNYYVPASFGSLELREGITSESIGQPISYQKNDCASVPVSTIDSLQLQRLDFLKLDVEGMEVDVLEGARETISAFRPVVVAETIKTDRVEMYSILNEFDYEIFNFGINILAVASDDPILGHVKQTEAGLSISV